MYRPPDIETLEDFNQYYKASYIGWRNPEETGDLYVPVFVGHSDGKQIMVAFEEGKQKLFAIKDILTSAQFGAPQYGSTEVGTSCIYVSRRSTRTAHRGHRPGNGLAVHSFHPALTGRGKDILGEYRYLKPLFNPQHRSLEDAQHLLAFGQRMACTLGRHWTLALVEGYKVPVLYYKTALVGYATDPNTIELEIPEDYRTLVAESFSGVNVK